MTTYTDHQQRMLDQESGRELDKRAAKWITNNPKAAALLRAADRAYERAREKAAHLPLAEKVAAYSAARLIRDAAYKLAAES